jgi:hypothetical protein
MSVSIGLGKTEFAPQRKTKTKTRMRNLNMRRCSQNELRRASVSRGKKVSTAEHPRLSFDEFDRFQLVR